MDYSVKISSQKNKGKGVKIYFFLNSKTLCATRYFKSYFKFLFFRMKESSKLDKRDFETIFKIIIEDHKRSLNSVQDELTTLKLQQAVTRGEESSLRNEVLSLRATETQLRNEVSSLRATETQLRNEVSSLRTMIQGKEEIIEAKEETIRILRSK
jgi:septal ring factor EnvC (AmiA/AmiB activator)